jgi:Cu(I)/Ag(I) efflux system periplasmic protein CusF
MNPQRRLIRSAGLALVLAATIALPAWAASHQGGQAAPADPGRPAAPAATPQANPVEMTDGEVRRLDKEAGKLTIRHATIKSLDMPPMTMVFVAKDKAMLDKLKVGDKIKFSAIKDAGQYTVTEIQVAQ